jgi:hypothetical protein
MATPHPPKKRNIVIPAHITNTTAPKTMTNFFKANSFQFKVWTLQSASDCTKVWFRCARVGAMLDFGEVSLGG